MPLIPASTGPILTPVPGHTPANLTGDPTRAGIVFYNTADGRQWISYPNPGPFNPATPGLPHFLWKEIRPDAGVPEWSAVVGYRPGELARRGDIIYLNTAAVGPNQLPPEAPVALPAVPAWKEIGSTTQNVTVSTVAGESPAAPGTAVIPAPVAGDHFINTTDATAFVYSTAGGWVSMASPPPNVTVSAVAGAAPTAAVPPNSKEGDWFLNTTDGKSWVYDGTNWVESSSVPVVTVTHTALQTPTTNPPATPAVGDLFVNDSDGATWVWALDPLAGADAWILAAGSTPTVVTIATSTGQTPGTNPPASAPNVGDWYINEVDDTRWIWAVGGGPSVAPAAGWQPMTATSGNVYISDAGGTVPANPNLAAGQTLFTFPAGVTLEEGDRFVNRFDHTNYVYAEDPATPGSFIWVPLPADNTATVTTVAGEIPSTGATAPQSSHIFTRPPKVGDIFINRPDEKMWVRVLDPAGGAAPDIWEEVPQYHPTSTVSVTADETPYTVVPAPTPVEGDIWANRLDNKTWIAMTDTSLPGNPVFWQQTAVDGPQFTLSPTTGETPDVPGTTTMPAQTDVGDIFVNEPDDRYWIALPDLAGAAGATEWHEIGAGIDYTDFGRILHLGTTDPATMEDGDLFVGLPGQVVVAPFDPAADYKTGDLVVVAGTAPAAAVLPDIAADVIWDNNGPNGGSGQVTFAAGFDGTTLTLPIANGAATGGDPWDTTKLGVGSVVTIVTAGGTIVLTITAVGTPAGGAAYFTATSNGVQPGQTQGTLSATVPAPLGGPGPADVIYRSLTDHAASATPPAQDTTNWAAGAAPIVYADDPDDAAGGEVTVSFAPGQTPLDPAVTATLTPNPGDLFVNRPDGAVWVATTYGWEQIESAPGRWYGVATPVNGATAQPKAWDIWFVTPTVTVTAGTPGTFHPAPPADLAALQALGALGQGGAWTTGQSVPLGDATDAYWDGAAWQAGQAPAPAGPPTAVAAGAPGTWVPGNAIVPTDLAALQALGALGQNAPWQLGENIPLGTGTAYWDGTAWQAGVAPAPPPVVTAGHPGAITPIPATLAALQALGALGQTNQWSNGQDVLLGDGSTASWDGTAWRNGPSDAWSSVTENPGVNAHATPGNAGSAAADLATMNAWGALGNTGAWTTTNSFILLGDQTRASWDGNAWVGNPVP